MSDYTRSPLFDPDFINEASAGSPLADALSSGDIAPALAVSNREGHSLTDPETLGRDLLEMNYAQLEQKYGREVADNQYVLQEEIDRQLRVQRADRTNTEVVKDTAIGVSTGAVDLLGSLGSAVLMGAGAVDEYFDPENTGFSEMGIALSQGTRDLTEWGRGFQSSELQDRIDLSQVEAELDAIDSQIQYEQDIADGDSEFIASLSQVGRDVLNTGERILSDGAVTGDIIAQGIGSLGPSAKLAGTGARLATGLAARTGAREATQRAAGVLGAATGVGISEASGSLTDAVNQVMDMSHEELAQNSAHFRGLIEEGYSPEDAQLEVATVTGRVAFGRQLPTATALGLISARFEAAPLGAFSGQGVLGAFRQIGQQTLEEAAQGASGTYNVNAAIQNYADENRSLTEGVGDALATGAIAGAGMAGVLSGPATVVNTGRDISAALTGETASDILAAAGRGAGNVLDGASNVAQAAAERAGPYVAPVVDRVRPAAQALNERVVQPAGDFVADIADRPNTKIQGEIVTAAETLSGLDTGDTALSVAQTDAVSESFSDYVSDGDTLVGTVSGIAKSLAFGKSKVSSLPESDVIYAFDKFQQLKNISETLPDQMKEAAREVLRSPDFKRLQRRMKTIDLNQTQTNETEVTPQTVGDTVRVARNNPTNVNPEFVGKILQHSDRKDLSEDDVRLLEAASKIAQAVNNHRGEKVQISKDNRVALSQKPAYKANPSKLPDVLDEESVSRSIQVGGFTDKRGTKLRSVNDFAADIFKGGQNPEGGFTYINDEGYEVSSGKVAQQFGLFTTHMINKVEALNESFERNDERGKGPSVAFDSLVGGEKIVKAGEKGNAAPVAYHQSSPKSVTFARNVYNDAVVAAEVYNTLVETFPELFPNGPIQVPVLRQIGDQNTLENTTAVEEEAAPQETASDEQPQTEEGQTNDEPDVSTDGTTESDVDVPNVDEASDSIQEQEEVAFPVSERFNNTFIKRGGEVEYSDGDTLINLVENKEYSKFARVMLKPLMKGVNKRLETVKVSKKDQRSLKELVQSGDTDALGFQRFKVLNMVNPETGRYDDQLLSLATVAVIDWLTGARAPDPSRLDETLEDLGLNWNDLTQEQLFDIANGVSPRQASEAIAKQVVRLWNTEINPDAEIGDIRGISEGIVKEILTVLGESGKLVQIKEIPVRLENGNMGKTETLNVSPMREIQKRIGKAGQNSVQKLLIPEDTTTPSFGEKLLSTDQTQSRGDVPLSSVEKKALKAMQDTAHYVSEGVSGFVEALGFEGLSQILGYVDMDNFRGNDVIARSVEGKNMSIERDFDEALEVVNAAREVGKKTAIYYPVSVSKVGRHQFKGVNPQNNKILRAMATPTFSTLDMTNQEDHDAFWLTVAQAADLFKVENLNHGNILTQVKDTFYGRFGEAVELAAEWVKTGELDTAEFAEAMGSASMAEVSAVVAVAQLHFAQENGTESSFETSLSFELDGKTDGPANMMSNFGQGLLSEQDMENFKRVGFFLGQKGMTLNKYFGGNEDNVDLYETTSKRGDLVLSQMARKAKDPSQRAVLMAASRFAAAFGDFKIDPKTGDAVMTRNTSKNPMTKTVYGSGVRGVGVGIAQDMILNFYKAFVDGPDVDTYEGYGALREDIKLLFGDDLPSGFNTADMKFGDDSVKRFEDVITKSIGTIIADAAKDTIGAKITKVNDALVFMTNVQAEYLSRRFETELEALGEKLAKEGKIKRNAKGVPILSQISQREYNGLVKRLSVFAPLYSNGSQTLAVGSFSSQPGSMVLSSSLTDKFRQKSTMLRPDNAGVKVIPYISIGRGDAMMMNTIYSGEDAPTDTLPVFDGIDMPVSRVKEYAERINKAVMNNWDQDVLGNVVQDFESFLRHVGNDPMLSEAFAAVAENSESTVSAKTPDELKITLNTFHKQNQARKRAFKRVPLSVDHMGGSDTSYSRGPDEVMDRAQINALIQEELDKTSEPVLKESESYDELAVTTGEALVGALLKETKNKAIGQTVRAIKNKLPADLKIVTGSLDQLNEYRRENFENDGQILTGAGNYDQNNGVIFLAKNGEETLVHELVHAATHNQIKAHYDGETNASVTRLEALMDEFMGLDFSKESKEVRDAANATRDAILTTRVNSQADALSEFVAWTLANEQLAQTLKKTRTSALATFGKKALQLIKKLMGGVPNDMFSHIVFNTKLLDITPPNNNGGGNNNGNGGDGNGDGGDVTPPARKYTNFWIDLVRQRLEENKVPGNIRGKSQRARVNQTVRYQNAAQSALDKLDFAGFSLSNYEKQTFKAIHMVLAAEMRLDTRSMLAMKKSFDYVTDNLTPEMFGPNNAQERYSTVMELFGATKNDEGVSDAISSLLALSQVSRGFRKALSELPTPEAENTQAADINEFLAISTQFLMRKAVGSVETAGREVVDVLDQLAENIIIQDQEKEYSILRTAMQGLDKADAFTSGVMSQVAERAADLDRSVRESDRSGLTKFVAGSAAFAAAFLDKDRSEIALGGIKDVTHMGRAMDHFVPVREFVAEIVGSDKTNKETVALLDRTNRAVSGVRQAFREDLPVILQNAFTEAPTAAQWKVLHKGLGKTDFAALFDLSKPAASMDLITESGILNRRVEQAERAIQKNFPQETADLILLKSQQLADFMNGNGAGHQLWRNAYAINKLSGQYNEAMTGDIDRLVSLYALQGLSTDEANTIAEMYQNDPEGVKNLIVYMQGLNLEEDIKDVSEEAKINGYKGYIPDHGKQGARLIIANDDRKEELQRMGFIRVGSYTAETEFSSTLRGYYFSTVKQSGTYSQGVLQNVHDTYRGVDGTTGLTVTGMTSGILTNEEMDAATKSLNKNQSVRDPKVVLLPVYSDQGLINYYERAIDPDYIETYLQPSSNLALMLGAWAGRQVEEKFAQQYNNELVDQLKSIWDNREVGSDDLFIDLSASDLKDRVYQDTWNTIPAQTKTYILQTFGDEGFPVRKDMINLALGYREASVLDVWTGKTRLPETVQNVVKAVANMTIGQFDEGNYTMKVLGGTEGGIQTMISAAKDNIVIRSLVVMYMNLQANVIQLTTRGVGPKAIIRGYRDKFQEIEKYNENEKKLIQLDTQIRLAANNKNRVAILESQRQAIYDENARMSIAPLITAGAYKNISEGITDLDVELTSGKFVDWMENQMNKLPSGVSTVVKYGLIAKDTALYKGANKAVQYGDFLAKAVMYDHLFESGMTHDEAIAKINEEYVNFSTLPGRTRSYLESLGITWFLTFKIRIMKIALQIMQENPVRAMLIAKTVGDLGSPVGDNLASVIAQDRLDYSLGWDMLFGSPELNPWVNMTDWASDQ